MGDRNSEGTRVWVGGAHTDITPEDFEKAFGKFGEIVRTERMVGFAFVTYRDKDAAAAAARGLDRQRIKGHNVNVRIANDANRANSSTSCFKCHKEGHVAAKCPNRSRTPERFNAEPRASRESARPRSRSPPTSGSHRVSRASGAGSARQRSRSPAELPPRPRSISPRMNAPRQRSRTPIRHRSRSPPRQRSRSPRHAIPPRQRSLSPRFDGPSRQVAPSQLSRPRQRAPSPSRRFSRSPPRRDLGTHLPPRSRSPLRRFSRSPPRRFSRSPPRREFAPRDPHPRRRSPSPVRRDLPAPTSRDFAMHRRERTPPPVAAHPPIRHRSRTRSPENFKRTNSANFSDERDRDYLPVRHRVPSLPPRSSSPARANEPRLAGRRPVGGSDKRTKEFIMSGDREPRQPNTRHLDELSRAPPSSNHYDRRSRSPHGAAPHDRRTVDERGDRPGSSYGARPSAHHSRETTREHDRQDTDRARSSHQRLHDSQPPIEVAVASFPLFTMENLAAWLRSLGEKTNEVIQTLSTAQITGEMLLEAFNSQDVWSAHDLTRVLSLDRASVVKAARTLL